MFIIIKMKALEKEAQQCVSFIEAIFNFVKLSYQYPSSPPIENAKFPETVCFFCFFLCLFFWWFFVFGYRKHVGEKNP